MCLIHFIVEEKHGELLMHTLYSKFKLKLKCPVDGTVVLRNSIRGAYSVHKLTNDTPLMNIWLSFTIASVGSINFAILSL